MLFPLHLYFVLAILIHIGALEMGLTTQDPVPPLLVTRLIHDHSVNSPYFDPKKTIKELADIDLQSSISNAKYLISNTSVSSYLTDIESQLTPKLQRGFLANLKVGEQYTDQLVYMDTGSSLLWINCEPCGLNVPAPIYHPQESSSYRMQYCNRDFGMCEATGTVRTECDIDNICQYHVRYGSEDYSAGHIATETIKFGRSKGTVRNILIGCASSTTLYANGVLGLGASVLSLITQLQYSKFSYCIGNISDRSYPYNTLVIGDRIELIGYKTPMIIEDKYYINLESIKIGNKLLDIDSEIFRRKPDYNGGMVLDTGSTYSFIPQVALDQFEGETGKLIDLLLVRNSSIKYREYTRLCYNGVLTRDLTGFPTVQFQFQGDATMELTDENIFQQTYDGTFCLAILPSETLGTSISLLGNLMQQYFYIAYDLRDKKLSFQRMDCNTVDDYIHDEL
ncbi:UNVERIFIED_CONTAM: Aspartic proteinase nepenthesin-2 [Sesamum radiatum]|uniref:Aspartic proteinase nepenthesin-2 n=1 Tax=Sesamum radiatum TaxID=300843 RepID=A0AAW2NBZ4_SESRA